MGTVSGSFVLAERGMGGGGGGGGGGGAAGGGVDPGGGGGAGTCRNRTRVAHGESCS